MPPKSLVITLLFVFAAALHAQTIPVSKDKAAEDEAKLNMAAVDLLRETSVEVGRLRTMENRISFNAELASLMWFHDDKEARVMYGTVVTDFKQLLSQHLVTRSSGYWLERLHAEDMWAMEVLDWKRLTSHEGYRVLEMEQAVTTERGKSLLTTRCPIRINGERLFSEKAAPRLGEDNEKIVMELLK